MIRSRAEGRPRRTGRGPSGRCGAQTAQARMSATRRSKASLTVLSVVLFAADGVSDEDEMIALVVAGISRIIDERPQDVQAEPADLPICPRLVEIRQGADLRVERPAVIGEFNFEPSGLQAEGDLDPARRRFAVIAMIDSVDEQLFEDDQEPSALGARQSV